MRMVDLIAKKKQGGKLSGEEIAFFIHGYSSGEIPDYQASAMTMAICFSGMHKEETARMTMEMARSGEMVDLSEIPGIKVDKHSTGGVGDKTTLVVAPVVASLGAPVAKMSGRGLGFTGGTLDKLESIPGYRVSLTRGEFIACVKRIGISVAGQSGELAPADKKLYALRDATASVESIPLIASSVMSKKIASGADAIVLDVKTGSGAFLKTIGEALTLAGEMVSIGKNAGRSTIALVTDMDVPLGYSIGNSLEVIEAVETLRGRGPDDLETLCLDLASEMLRLAGKGDLGFCRALAEAALRNGKALEKLIELVEAQGGDASYIRDTSKFPLAPLRLEYRAAQDGYITRMDAGRIGRAAMLLGAGRKDKDSPVDYGAGIILKRKPGDMVRTGDVIAELYTNNKDPGSSAELENAVEIGAEPPAPGHKIIRARISGEGLR